MNGVLADTSVWIQPFNNQGGNDMKNIIERIAGGAKIARYLPKAVSTRLAVAASFPGREAMNNESDF